MIERTETHEVVAAGVVIDRWLRCFGILMTENDCCHLGMAVLEAARATRGGETFEDAAEKVIRDFHIYNSRQ